MNLTAIITECKARGFDFDSDTRWGYWINRAYTRLCEREAWTFLETTATGSSPLPIADLRTVLSVIDTTNDSPLDFEDYRTLREGDPGLDDTGSPAYWYLSDATTVSCWPTTSTSLSVHYLKVPEELTDGSDEPVFPSRYHYALVDGAVAYAYKDSDNAEMAQNAKDDFEEVILEMTDTLLVPNFDTPRSIVVTGSTDW